MKNEGCRISRHQQIYDLQMYDLQIYDLQIYNLQFVFTGIKEMDRLFKVNSEKIVYFGDGLFIYSTCVFSSSELADFSSSSRVVDILSSSAFSVDSLSSAFEARDSERRLW